MKRTTILIVSTIIAAVFFIIMYFLIGFSVMFSTLTMIALYLLLFNLLSAASPVKSYNIARDELLIFAEERYGVLVESYRVIKDKDMSSNIYRLIRISYSVITHIKHHPDDIERSRHFITFYLSEVSKLIQRYVELEDKIDNETIRKTKRYVRDEITIIIKGFDYEYSKVMKRFTHEIEEISVGLREQSYLDDLRSKY